MRMLFTILLAAVIIGCASQSTTPFDPTKKINVDAEEVYRQAGMPKIRQGMDCREYYEAMLQWCHMSYDCTAREARNIKRARRRVGLFCIMTWTGIRR